MDAGLVLSELTAMAAAEDARWLSSFHAGDREVLEASYREHFAAVIGAVRRYLRDVDAETVTHEVFLRLLSDDAMRAGFHEGDLGAWLRTIATRAAIDQLRRLRREGPEATDAEEVDPGRVDDEVEAKLLIERFRAERLPEKWRAVFDARFLRQLPQRDAARALGIHRTTLVYQEHRIRGLLEKFLLREEER